MSETILRQWDMLQYIPHAPGKIGTPDLVKKLKNKYEVSDRTVQRDLEHLSGLFPLRVDDRTKPYGWQWANDSKLLHIPCMDPRTAMLFKLVEKFLENIMPKQALSDFSPYLQLADNILKESGASRYAIWSNLVAIAPRGYSLLPATVDNSVLNTVYEALFKGERFKASYHHRPTNTKKNYESINPLGLVIRDGVIYLVCTFSAYTDIRQLALHRLTSTELLNIPSSPIEGFSLEHYIDEEHAMQFPLNKGLNIRLEVLFSEPAGFHLLETPMSNDQETSEEKDGRLRVIATVADTAQLRWWLLGFGDKVEVVKPIRLRESMAEIANNMSARYR